MPLFPYFQSKNWAQHCSLGTEFNPMISQEGVGRKNCAVRSRINFSVRLIQVLMHSGEIIFISIFTFGLSHDAL